MTASQTPPGAFDRAWPLLTEPPRDPDLTNGYLDLLGGQDPAPPGLFQTLWSSQPGSALYDHAQGLYRRLSATARLPESVLSLPDGARALDVGCGPGNVTAELGRATGASGLAVGLDVSRPMLARAAYTESSDNVCFVRADARELPFRDGVFDVVTSVAALQLIPSPMTVLTRMCHALAPGGRLAVMVPTVHGSVFHRLARLLGDRTGLEFFAADDLADHLHANGLSTVHTRQTGLVLWITGHR